MTPTLSMWTIYDHPLDFPDCFVARRFEGVTPTLDVETAPTLDELRGRFRSWGLACLTRSPEDDAAIVEVWL